MSRHHTQAPYIIIWIFWDGEDVKSCATILAPIIQGEIPPAPISAGFDLRLQLHHGREARGDHWGDMQRGRRVEAVDAVQNLVNGRDLAFAYSDRLSRWSISGTWMTWMTWGDCHSPNNMYEIVWIQWEHILDSSPGQHVCIPNISYLCKKLCPSSATLQPPTSTSFSASVPLPSAVTTPCRCKET
jgi:hypothetical protein